MQGVKAYLSREGFKTEVDEMDRDEAIENAAERAYYAARLSDPTYHGTNHNAKCNAVTKAVKTWPQLEIDDWADIDRRADALIDERTGI